MRASVFAFFFVISSFASASVWENKNAWSPATEFQFSAWVKSSWNTNVFSRASLDDGSPNPYFGLRVDCADTVYSMRAIFAFENKLPFAFQDPTNPGKIISNNVTKFDRISSQNERFRQFMWWVYEIVSTRSLPNDTYPVAINRQSVRPGGVLLTTHLNHHSWSIKEILPIGVPSLIFNSRVGKASGLELQARQSWPNPDWVFEGDFSAAGEAGFRYWKPVELLLEPAWKIPGYSDEQYKIPLDKWVQFAQQKLATKKESPSQEIIRLLQTVCDGFKSRIPAVQDGLQNLDKSSGCYDYATYDNFSTPNRDRRVFDDLIALRKSYQNHLSHANSDELNNDLLRTLQQIFPFIQRSAAEETALMEPVDIADSQYCELDYQGRYPISLAEAKRRLFAGLISNNPLDGLAERWGEVKGPSDRAQSCPNWNAWKPGFDSNDELIF